MNLYELTTAKLDQYTKAADADYEKAKAAGDYKKSLKRATGMMKASGKKIDNDVKALQKARGVAEGSDDIEDTRQFRDAIALAKSQKAIRQARYGKDQKFYSDGTPVTPEETARRAAERKAKKQGVAENNMPPPQQSSTQDTPQQAKVRAALEKGLQISDKNDADEVSRKTAQNDKRLQRVGSTALDGAVPIRRHGGWDSRGIRAIVSIEPDGTIVADKGDYHDLASLKRLLAWGGMAGTKIISTHEFNQIQSQKQDVAEDQLDELTGWKQSSPQQKTSAQPKKPTTGELLKKSNDKRSELQRNYDAGKKNWFKEGQFDPINDDDYYEYNVNTKEIVKHISGKHPIASKFNPLQKEWPGRDADHKIVRGLQAKYLKDDVVDEKVSDYIPTPLVNKHSIVKSWRKAKGLDEGASIDQILANYPKEVELFKQGGDLDYDLEGALWDYYFNKGEIRNYDVDASEFVSQRLAYELGIDEATKVAEIAPPGAKAERMVKHIKKGYAKDGKLTPKEKSIAYATAWKAHNAGKV